MIINSCRTKLGGQYHPEVVMLSDTAPWKP